MRYSISYDLNRPGQLYSRIAGELQRLGGRRLLFSQWAINWPNTTAIAVRDHLRRFIDSNDRLMVIQLDGDDWASYNAMTDPNTLRAPGLGAIMAHTLRS